MSSLTLVEEYWEYYPNLLRKRYYVDEYLTKQGLYESWYHNGHKDLQLQLVNDECHGLCRYWHDNGQLFMQSEYVNNKRQGLYQRWYDNGVEDLRCWFDKDIELIRVTYSNKVIIMLSRDQSIESGVFLGNVISSLEEEGVEYDISYFD
jgi:antitoxin component YwqK of YwqJK toxin-antitoxin module